MILALDVSIQLIHLKWGLYMFTKTQYPPKNPEDVVKWLQRVILRDGTIKFRAVVAEWEKESPQSDEDQRLHAHVDSQAEEWWSDVD